MSWKAGGKKVSDDRQSKQPSEAGESVTELDVEDPEHVEGAMAGLP